MKVEIKKWVDANIWDGEDRSGCKNDFASFNPDELQELLDDLCDDLITPKLESAKADIDLLNREIAALKAQFEVKQSLEYVTLAGEMQAHIERLAKVKADAFMAGVMATSEGCNGELYQDGWQGVIDLLIAKREEYLAK